MPPHGSESPSVGRGAWARPTDAATGLTRPLPPEAGESFVIVAESHRVDVTTEWDPHEHPAHELIWVRGGTLTARIENRVFTVSDGHGLWIPAGRSHSGRLTAGVTLCDAFFADVRGALPGDEATVVVMTPVLESLLMYLGQNTIADDQRARAEAVVFDVLLPSDRELAVTVPRDAAVVPIVEALLADPSDRRSLTRWASEMAVSERTITRAFRTSTGLSFAQWRQTVRVHRAMSLLAEGTEVGEVAELIGYAQTGTFIDAFRRVMGTTPGSFQAAVRAERVRKS